MRRFFLDIILAVIICIILLVVLRLFANVTGFFLSDDAKFIYRFFQSIIFLFCLVSIAYKRLWGPSVVKSKKKATVFLLIQISLLVLIYHFISINKNVIEYYKYFTAANFISWQGKMYNRDDTLGYRMIKNNRSSLVYNLLQTAPVRTDKNGFRIPDSIPSLTDTDKPVDLLFLGCSFTFGSACRAENTFPYLVAAEKKMNYVNAAVGGYGLAQMYLQAMQLIPRLKPKYIIVQNSPWLISRGVSEFAPSRGGYLLPTPYFTDDGPSFRTEFPIYKSSVEGLFPAEDRKNYNGNFLKYYFKKGFPYFFKEQAQLFFVRCKNLFFLKQRPTKKAAEAEQFAYAEIFRIAEQYSAKVILLNLSNPPGSDKCLQLSRGHNVSIANADSVLYKIPGAQSEIGYRKKFNHWAKSGKDSVLVDSHPNSFAHRLIAESVLMHIEK